MSSVSSDSRSCLSCGAETDSAATACPECGGLVRGAKSIRQRGWWMVIIGLALTVFFGVVIINEALNVYHSGEPNAKVRYTGGPWMRVLMFGILGMVLAMGVGFIATGIWQILYGKPNIKLLSLIVGLFGLLMTIAYIVSWFR